MNSLFFFIHSFFFFIKITLKTGWTIVIIIKRIEESEKFKFNSIKWLGIWENNRAYLWSDRCIYYEYNRLPWILKMTDHCVLQSSGSRDLITLKIFRSLLIISFLFLYRVINMDGSYSWLLILWLFLHMKKTWGPVFILKFTIKGLDSYPSLIGPSSILLAPNKKDCSWIDLNYQIIFFWMNAPKKPLCHTCEKKATVTV